MLIGPQIAKFCTLVTRQNHLGPRSYFSRAGHDPNNPGRSEYIPPLLSTCRIQNLDIPQAGRVGAHGEAAGRGRAGLDADRAFRPGDKRPPLPKARKTRRLNVSPEARTRGISYKQMGEHNERLTSGLCPVCVRFITGTRSALCSWLLTSGPTPFCLCKPFSCKACPGTRLSKTRQRQSVEARD